MKVWLKRVIRAGVALIGVVGVRLLWALIPPLSPEELREQSELILEGAVLGVAFVRFERDEHWNYRHYRAWLFVHAVEKGDARPNGTLEVAWVDTVHQSM